jgi:hypothetical protein
MWSTPLIVVCALGLALPPQETRLAPAGPTDGPGQPGRSFFPLHPVAIIGARLLLDSRGVDVSMASNPTFVFLSSLEPLFFNSPENELRFSDNTGT